MDSLPTYTMPSRPVLAHLVMCSTAHDQMGKYRPGRHRVSRETIHEERSLVLHCCGGVGSTWMGHRRVDVGPPGSVGFHLVFSGGDSRSVPHIGGLGLFRACSSMGSEEHKSQL